MANEKRLVDPKKALYLAEHSGLYDFDLSALETLLFDEPCIAVDAVEVVRCKDCIGWCPEKIAKEYKVPRYCTLTRIPTDPDDFCSYGERRTE